MGDSGWSSLVENYMDLASHLEGLIEQSDKLEMMSSRQWTNVCFRYNDKSIENLNQFNSELRTRLIENGNFMISKSNIGNDVILRPVIANPAVEKSTLEGLVEEILQIAHEMKSGIPHS